MSAPLTTDSRTKLERDLPAKVEALDGLRGIAILLVLCCHFHAILDSDPKFVDITPWAPLNQLLLRGFLGVDLFFVLSGFLITSLLFKTNIQKPYESMRHFYIRRVLRLFPALFALLFASFIVSYFEKYSLSEQWTTTWSAVLFISNWNLKWNFGHIQSDLGHLWSLAVEEQFYLIWPSILIALRYFRSPRWMYFLVVTSLVTLVVLHRIELWNANEPWLFLYSRTDTRVDSMLVGCLVAFTYRYFDIDTKFLKALGVIATIVVIPLAYHYAGGTQGFLYKGGFTLFAVLFGLIILACVSCESVGTGFLSNRILKWFGKVSYGLYLWHVIIFRISERHFHFGSNAFRFVTTTVFSLLVAELSWRFIEQPFLRLKNRRYQEKHTLPIH